jgi:hypothetical protein
MRLYEELRLTFNRQCEMILWNKWSFVAIKTLWAQQNFLFAFPFCIYKVRHLDTVTEK